MGVINCCHFCVAPKRYPGCHSNCPEYTEEKAGYDRRKEAEDKKRNTKNNIYNQRTENVAKALKKHGRH